MCRLYGLQASHPTRAACELLDTQNAIIDQSKNDARGLSNPHGWGMGHVAGGTTSCFRQVKPASESSKYREKALEVEGAIVLTHIRRATVGDPKQDNTHPFRYDTALLIHNGHVPAFDEVRPRLLDRLSEEHRFQIQGRTDSEHIFALLLQLNDEMPEAPLHTVTKEAIRHLQMWVQEADADTEVGAVDAPFEALPHEEITDTLGLNLLWTDGDTLAGSRLNRTLWSTHRTNVHTCPVCGSAHTDSPVQDSYRATVLASERITNEDWTEVPNASVFSVSEGTLYLEEFEAGEPTVRG